MSYDRFIGRKNELNSLKLLMKNQKANLVVIRGRRRVGKSRLIEEFAKGSLFLRFAGIPPTEKINAQFQRDVFAKQLSQQCSLPELSLTDWADLFALLVNQTEQGRVIILLDEITWMGSKDPTFLGKLKNAWDLAFSKNSKLMLILCGSVSTWIEKNIIQSTGFFGRISLKIILNPLILSECNQLLDAQGFRGSNYDRFKLLSVTGGIPWYLEHVQAQFTADENIKQLCFQSNSLLLDEFESIFNDLFTKRGLIYRQIIELLAHGSLELNQIFKMLKYQKSGSLSEYLDHLVLSGFASRDYTWALKNGIYSRLSHFRLSDNYLRFYLKYVKPHRAAIQQGRFNQASLSALPNWDTIMGLQFENLVLANRQSIWQLLNIPLEDIVTDNPFFQRPTARQKGCQIDYMIQTRLKTLFICEIKFSRREIGLSIVSEVEEKIKRLSMPRGFSCRPILIHVNGVVESVEESRYFTNIINFGDLFFQ